MFRETVQKPVSKHLSVGGLFLPDARTTERPENWIASARIRLAHRRAEKPATKAGQIRALWPEIDAALSGGQSMKSIRKWLEEDAGITLGITSLTSYISRIRRREKAIWATQSRKVDSACVETKSESEVAAPDPSPPRAVQPYANPSWVSTEDPLAQAMKALSKRPIDIREIHNDGDPRGRKLI
jgi:hypothetical protein